MRYFRQTRAAGRASVAVLALGLILIPGSTLAVNEGGTGQNSDGWLWFTTGVSDFFQGIADYFLGLVGFDTGLDRGGDIGTNESTNGTGQSGQGGGGGASTAGAGSGAGRD